MYYNATCRVEGVVFSNRGVGVNGGESLPGSALVDELQDLFGDGQGGRRAEGGQLLFILFLLIQRG